MVPVLLNDLQLPFSFQLLKADKGFGTYLSMCFTSVVFADVRGTQNRCLCAFRDAFLKQGERKREKSLLPFLALLFSCVSNTLCAWFCLNPRMANNHTLWKLPTFSHPSLWFFFLSSCYWYLGTCGDKVMRNLEVWQRSLFWQCLCEALWCHEIPLSSTACFAFSNTAVAWAGASFAGGLSGDREMDGRMSQLTGWLDCLFYGNNIPEACSNIL